MQVTEFIYDLGGALPDRVFVPHVALRFSHPENDGTFDTPMLLDTGATSDYTLNDRSKLAIGSRLFLKESSDWGDVRLAAGPMSLLESKPSYSAFNLAHLPIMSPGGLRPAISSLRCGSRSDQSNTMSLKYFAASGSTIFMDPTLGKSYKITEYCGDKKDGPLSIYSTDVQLGGGFPTLKHTLECTAESELRVRSVLWGPKAKSSPVFICWDTGASVCGMPHELVEQLGGTGGVLPKLVMRTSAGQLLTFANVPTEDDTEVIMGAPILSLCRIAIKPGSSGSLGLSPVIPASDIQKVKSADLGY